MSQKLDILAFAAHPDDVELACSGTLIKHIQQGYKVGVVDLTQGELGTRGTPAIREEEAQKAADIMGLTIRENLGLRDGFFEIHEEDLLKVVHAIRKYQPTIVLANAVSDRHPDHGRGGDLVSRAAFLAGLAKIETFNNGEIQQRWRPEEVYHYIQFRYIQPDMVVDVTDVWDAKMKAIKAYKSQFYDPESKEPGTMIASEDFIHYIEARGREMGASIERTFGEGFTVERPLNVEVLPGL